MIRAFQYRRLLFLGVLLVAGLLWLLCELFHLQIQRHGELKPEAEQESRYRRRVEPLRGEIRDVAGRVAAITWPRVDVYVNPMVTRNHVVAVAQALAPLLQTNVAAIVPLLQPRLIGRTTLGEPRYATKVLLKRGVALDQWERFRGAWEKQVFGYHTASLTRAEYQQLRRLRTRALLAEEEYSRIYPYGALAAHVLGHAGPRGEAPGLAGWSGLEQLLDRQLGGRPGLIEGERDGGGLELVARRRRYLEPVDGLNVVLTLDLVLQTIVEEELARALEEFNAEGALAVMVQPYSGRILALASLPDFNPQQPGAAPTNAWRNAVIFDARELGSVMKIIVYAAALNEGTVRLDDTVDCERGYFVYKGRPLHDHAAYGLLTYLEAFAKSSNIGAVKLALLLGAEKLHHYLLAFGLGQPTGILLPHERAGLVRPLREWSPVSITSVPIGYEAAVTPLQLAMAMSALANDGRLMRPLLVDRVEDVQGQVRWRATNQVVRAVVRPEVARQFLPALKAAVSRQGTGGLAALSDFRVAGKTGTARKAKTRQAGYTRGGYEPGAYCATFCGFFPADAPEVCLLVILDEPRPQFYGGVTSARVFRRIGERVATYLHLAPDVGNLSTVAMHPMP